MSEQHSPKRAWAHTSKGVAIVLVLVLGLAGKKYLETHGPKADKEPPPRVIPVVRVITVNSADEQLYVRTQGRVEPGRRTQAASEVMGRVVMVSPKFKAGGVFAKNEIMLEIDSADYVSMLATAEASLADAKLLLAQEEARAEQAQRDWQKLGRGEPSDLVLRKPQIASAKARIASAEAAVGKATRDLDRTKLRAPYDCRVEAAYTDMGSFIVAGARLADVYSVDEFEVRVPVTLEEMGYLDKDDIIGAAVTTTATIGNQWQTWKGKVIRSEGLVDQRTMTIYLVAGIESNKSGGRYALPPAGLFVKAEIRGRTLEKVIKIPRSALRSDNTLLTVDAGNKLRFVPVQVARTLNKTVIISGGLKDGTRVIVSPMETPVGGMELSVEEVEAESKPATM
ncbi:MAG: efflux RND transporter periplasmic adaptor subunit [Akkermansiaceae bacterium]|nr:efflux RND transporter periplasmic adaptor subunit [Akkermansiaceae bacterium]